MCTPRPFLNMRSCLYLWTCESRPSSVPIQSSHLAKYSKKLFFFFFGCVLWFEVMYFCKIDKKKKRKKKKKTSTVKIPGCVLAPPLLSRMYQEVTCANLRQPGIPECISHQLASRKTRKNITFLCHEMQF